MAELFYYEVKDLLLALPTIRSASSYHHKANTADYCLSEWLRCMLPMHLIQ